MDEIILENLSKFAKELDEAIPQEVKDNIKGATKKIQQIGNNISSIIVKFNALAKIVENYNKRGLSSMTGDVVKAVREGVIDKDEAMKKIQGIMDSIKPTEKEPDEIESPPEEEKTESKTKSKKGKKLPNVKPEGSA